MRYRIPILITLLITAGLWIPSKLFSQPLNIIWITAEDLSPRLACYGDSMVPTPNIDRLASEGVRFTHAFATYGVCAPSRHSLIMGMYPTSTGAGAMRTHVRTSAINDITDSELLNIPVYEATPPPQAKCFTEYLRAAGYFCTNNSKTDYQFKPPITAWDESHDSAHYRQRPDPDMPFFSVFNFTTTHESRIHNPRSPSITDPAAIEVPPYYPDTETVRNDIAHHYDNIAVLDQQVGQVIKDLEEDGLISSTLVFFFTDHGDGLPRAKRWVYDSGIHVPLIVRHPDLTGAGTVNQDLVSFVDFAPTILSICNIDVPPHMEGLAFLGNQKGEPREYIYAFRDRMDPAFETIRAVRDHRYKYIRNYRPDLPYIGFIPYRDRMLMMQEILSLKEQGKLGPDQWQFSSDSKPLEELYDTGADRYEIHNLASDPKYLEKLTELRNAHDSWTNKHGDLNRLTDHDLIKMLWPPSGIQPVTAAPQIEMKDGLLHLDCQTPGSSIAYRLDGKGRWLLYSKPITSKGNTIEAQSIRLGYKPSAVTQASLE